MADLNRLLNDFSMAAGAGRRRLLMNIGMHPDAESLTIDRFGGGSTEPVFVVDADDELHVVDHGSGMPLAARKMGMEVYDPTPVQQEATAGTTSLSERWEVWCTMGESSFVLASADTEGQAQAAAVEQLDGMVGTLVLTLKDWVAGQLHAGFEPKPPRRQKREPVFGRFGVATLNGEWVAAGIYKYSWAFDPPAEEMLEAAIIEALSKTGGFTRIMRQGRARQQFTLPIAEMSGQFFANYHDLINAARSGVYLPNVLPWPRGVNANNYVVQREWQRFMRAKGWRVPWRNEKPVGALKLFDRNWLRDTPITT